MVGQLQSRTIKRNNQNQKRKTMKVFKDLEFYLTAIGGVGATHTFDNGVTISVQASKFNYSTPRENLPSSDDFLSFEVGMWDIDGNGVTKQFFRNNNDDVIGWQSREDINNLIKKIEQS